VSLKISRGLAPLMICAAALLLPAAGASAGQAAGPNWTNVKPKKVMLFSPAQTSFERLMTQQRHSGYRRYVEGKNCFSCHGNIDERPLGDALANAERFKEPQRIPGKMGYVDTAIKVARDAENIYVQLEFDTANEPNAGQDKEFDTKVAMMIDDGNVVDANRAGCWRTCHNDVATMQSGKDDVTKYVLETRAAGGQNLIDAAGIAEMKAKGQYFEYWQAKLNPGGKAVAVDGTILDKRTENATPAVKVNASNKGTVWTVTFSRKLTDAGEGHKDIVPGKTYNIGFAIHAGHTAKRFHYVSFERTLVLDEGTADFVAAK